jgi:prevent-host-death family protein
MKTVNVREARAHLSRLLARVARGEEILIARAGKPIARLVPVGASSGARALGIDRGRVIIAADFDALLPEEIVAAFEK